MSYMKWVAAVRDAAREQEAKGMLGVLAARAKIHEGRLRDWLTKKTIDDLNYGEVSALHNALGQKIELIESNKLYEPSNTQESRGKSCGTFASHSGCDDDQKSTEAFDSSD